MNEGKKVLFIINKFAGTGYQPELEGRILDTCQAHDVECTIQYTQYRGHATELAHQGNLDGFTLVIAVGGDGTVNEVAKGLLNSQAIMGIIPRGSGNGLARHLGIPMKISQAVASLFNSKVIAMDTFTVNGHVSLNVSGIGFDGHIANLFGQTKKRGLVGYVKLTIREFIRFTNFESTIVADSNTYERKAFIVAIGNSSQYGNNARITPTASLQDQLLDITLVKKIPPYRLDFVFDLFTGKISNSQYCETFKAKKILLTLKKPIAYHVDGEPSGVADRFEISIVPSSLHMLAPSENV